MEGADLLIRVEIILKGINKTESDSSDGWWETSTGAEFGEGILEELRELILNGDN